MLRTSLKYLMVVLLAVLPVMAQTQSATVHGTVADPDDAVIPGATVTLTPAAGKAQVTQSKSDGTYAVRNVAPGTYSVTVTMPGFASFVKQAVEVAAGQNMVLDAKMAIEEQQQQVMVTAQTTQLSVDQDSNASATVIKGKDLDALSDDPDELSNELSALAGPAAGPNGGQIYVDGFTGGALPPKSSIREIRVNQNPFSAQFERLGYGRVEVFTKPGTDKFHGSAQLNGNDSSFNTVTPLLNAFTPPGAPQITQQPYHTIFFFGNLTGPLSSNASFSVSGSRRQIQDNTLFNGTILSRDGTPAGLCAPGTGAGAVTGCSEVPYAITNSFPQTRTALDPRIDLALGEKNTLTMRLQMERGSSKSNGVGGFDLPSTAFDTGSSEYEFQVSDTQVVNSHIINETRMELGRNRDTQAAQGNAPTVNVQGNFTSGGANSGSNSSRQARLEFQNYTSIQLAKNFIRLGGRYRLNRESSYSNSGANGIFTYDSLASYEAGTPTQFSQTTNNVGVHALGSDIGVYLEDDWKARQNLTISYGFRYEAQNHVGEKHDFAPRVSFAYGLGQTKGSPKVVLRGGFGIFFDRFGLGNFLTTVRQNGLNQLQTQVQNPGKGCTPTTIAACSATVSGNNVTYVEAANLQRPYTMQFAMGTDLALFKGASVSLNYLHAQGVHQFFSQNLNAPLPGATVRNTVVVNQFQSEGKFKQDQLITNFNLRRDRVSLFGYYALSFAKGNTFGPGSFPTRPFDIGADYGRAGFDTRSRLFLGGNVTGPYRITISPFVVAQSGNPYNIVTGTDTNLDHSFNDRPAFLPGTTSANCLDKNTFYSPTPSVGATYQEIPVNYCTGPGLFTANFRVQKAFGFGPETGKPQGGGPGGQGPGGHGHHGGPGMFLGGGSAGRKYNFTLAAQVMNLFNNSDLGTPNGTLTSARFGQSTQLAGNIYTSNSAVRRVMLQVGFNF